jgi:cation transport ATPase
LDQIGWRQSQLPYRQDIRDARVASPGSIRGSLSRIFLLTGFTLFYLIRTFIFKSPLSPRWIVAGTLLAGLQLFRRALWDVKQGKFLSANIFLSGATLLATFTGESAAALEVLWIQEVGQLLEDYIQDRSRRAIREVILVSPQNAFMLVNESQVEVPITKIRTGDILCVHNTERIPVDGSVVGGEALFDESHITGRAEPPLRRGGDNVFAGTIVQQGFLHIKARNGKLQGLIGLRYEFKPRSVDVLQRLRQEGVSQIHLVSGDTHAVVIRTTDNLAMTSARGDMLPDEKARFVGQLVSEGKHVAMVGDGINDAPALALANIGIALGAGGAEAAIEAADIALVDNRLERLVFTRQLSHRTLRIIQQNHWFAVTTDLFGAIFAIIGLLPPILTGATHIVHTLTILTNSSRILSVQPSGINGKSDSN